MAHFAKLDSDNIVTQVITLSNEVLLDEYGNENEQIGKDFIETILGPGTWVQTSYNGNIRKNYAGVGYKYDSTRDAFIPPKPHDSWSLDEPSCLWIPPVDYPSDGNVYRWDEDDQEWIQVRVVTTV